MDFLHLQEKILLVSTQKLIQNPLEERI